MTPPRAADPAAPEAAAAATRDPGSFRDPSGFVFWRDGRPYRQIQARFALASIYDRAALGGGNVATPESGGESQGEIEEVAPDAAPTPMDGAAPPSAAEPEQLPPPVTEPAVTEPPVTDPTLTPPPATDPGAMEPGVDTTTSPEAPR